MFLFGLQQLVSTFNISVMYGLVLLLRCGQVQLLLKKSSFQYLASGVVWHIQDDK